MFALAALKNSVATPLRGSWRPEKIGPMKRLRTLALGLPLVLAFALHYGCTGDESSIQGPGTGGDAASGTGANGAGGGGASSSGTGGGGASSSGTGGGGASSSGTGGGGGNDAGLDGNFNYDAPPFDAALDEDSACAGDSVEASPVPLDIYLMLDRSGSMSTDCNVTWPNPPSTGSKWCRAINAIAGYVQDVGSEGNRAAIQFFSGNTGCNGAPFATPAVPLVDLTAQATQIVNALNGQAPSGNTPTEGALNGLAQFTAANQTPGRIIIGVLITDGDPTTCNTSDATLSNIIQQHFDNTGIHTFVVGMTGATFTRLESWADYNGAIQHDDTNDACGQGVNAPCYSYNVGDGDPAVFIWALQQIQNAVLGCTYNIPQPADGGVVDPDQVIVEYQPNGQPPGQELTRVTDVTQCVPDGWYYDDNNNPTIIQLCPDVCTTVQADQTAKVNILLGCQGS